MKALRTRAAGLGVVAAALGLTGCSSDVPARTLAAREALSADVAALHDAAGRGTPAEVGRAAAALRADVTLQQKAGVLSAERAAAIRDQLARVLADLAARPTPRATATARPPVTTAPQPATGGEDKGESKGKGKGKD